MMTPQKDSDLQHSNTGNLSVINNKFRESTTSGAASPDFDSFLMDSQTPGLKFTKGDSIFSKANGQSSLQMKPFRSRKIYMV